MDSSLAGAAVQIRAESDRTTELRDDQPEPSHYAAARLPLVAAGGRPGPASRALASKPSVRTEVARPDGLLGSCRLRRWAFVVLLKRPVHDAALRLDGSGADSFF
jgi:hypothetical protein